VKTGPGDYTIRWLHPDRSEATLLLKAAGDYLDIGFPGGDWSVSGIVVQGPKSKAPLEPQTFAKTISRPAIRHEQPRQIDAGQPLTLKIRISPATEMTRVHLYYPPVNQLAKFKTIEIVAGQDSVTIPGEDVSPKWDLMYYFEVLNRAGGGWFCPDPQTATPYYVVKVRPAHGGAD
jgi:hypothetical protein